MHARWTIPCRAVYYEFHDARGNQDYVFRSRDNGKTWSEPTLVGEHYNETGTSRAERRNGTCRAAIRDRRTSGNVVINRWRKDLEPADANHQRTGSIQAI